MENDLSLANLSIEENFVPGLLSLNMNITYVLDIHQIEDQIQGLSIRKEIEHPCVHDVLDNMIAILKLKLPRERLTAKYDLQQVHNRNQNNLNALADLENMYRGLHRLIDAEKCKTAMEKILNGPDKTYKALCLMEQGYALIHDMDANIEHLANNKLTDAHKMLQAEHKHSDKERSSTLQKCVFHNKLAIAHLDDSMKFKRKDPYFIRKHDALEKFQQALAMCDQIPHKNVWEYYIAEAWNRSVDSLNALSEKDLENKKEKIVEATCNSLELYFRVANSNEQMEKKNMYVSRSLVQIGHILTKRSKLLSEPSQNLTFLHDENYNVFLHDPMIPLKKACEMQLKPDTFILNRYGRALYNRAFKSKEQSLKKNDLETADNILSQSIESNKMNWFAYSTRMLVSQLLCDVLLPEDHHKAHAYLKKAHGYGYQCFISKGSSIDMKCLAGICQKLSKFPNFMKYGKDHVKEVRYLYDAIDYLQHGLTVAGQHDHELAYLMASCLHDLGEFTSAAEWMKRTIALAEKPRIYYYKMACLYQLERFRFERDQNKKPLYLIKEITYILQECKRKFNEVNDVFEYIVRNACSAVCGLIEEIAEGPKLLTQEGINIILALLRVAEDFIKSKQLTLFEKKIRRLSPLSDEEVNVADNFRFSAGKIPIPLDASLVPTGFEYNFFVSHSQKDVEWVTNVLLFELESKYTEDDLAFKGCFHERDFHPGKTIMQNITDAIKKSCKIIVVLTKHFIKSPWCRDEMEKALIRHIREGGCVIPIMLDPTLEDSEYPDCLGNITYLDLTMQNDELTHRTQIKRLKSALLPGE